MLETKLFTFPVMAATQSVAEFIKLDNGISYHYILHYIHEYIFPLLDLSKIQMNDNPFHMPFPWMNLTQTKRIGLL